MEKIILKRLKNHKKEIKCLFNKIKEYDRIAVFRHDHPDFDAIGTQMGLVEFIKTNFKNKEVIYLGDDHITLSKSCFPKMMNVDDAWFEKPFLAIIVDLSNIDRVADERCKKASYTIKIDHHPFVEKFANLELIDPSMVSAGEFLTSIIISGKYKISKECAAYLWKAIIGDSGRFLYQETSVHTFFVAQKLMEAGIDIKKIYRDMYEQSLTQLEIQKFVLQNYKISKKGVAYYVLTDKDLKRFNLKPIQGKENINLFSNFKGVNAWLSCTEDKSKGNWRVSIRSAKKPINKVAEKYNGGGHANASGCKIKTLKVLKNLIDDLDKLF